MAVGEAFRPINNIRPVGSEAVAYEYVTIPGSVGPGSYLYRLTELPLNVPLANPQGSAIECREVDSFDVELPGPVRLTAISQEDPLISGTFTIKSGTLDIDDSFKFGQIRFSQYDAGKRYKVIYTGRGSLVWADDILNLNYGLSLLPETIKPGHISSEPSDSFEFPGDVTINGNFNVVGHTNHLLSEIWTTVDDFVRLNSDFTSGSPTVDAGLQVSRGSSPDASLTWDEAGDKWVFSGGPLSVPSGISVNRWDVQAAPSQTVFGLPFQYNAGTNQLMVFLNGLLQTRGLSFDYQETSISLGLSSEVTFNESVESGSVVSFMVIGV